MKHATRRPSVLALVGLAALVVYVLACGTFSPDDSKVMYPTFDAKSGALGVAIYDRTTRRSELIFLPRFYGAAEPLVAEARLLRSQWLGGGKDVLIAWPGQEGGSEEDGLNLALVPVGGAGAVRLFFLPHLADAVGRLAQPLPVAGSRVFVVGESNRVLRLDLVTGEVATHTAPAELRLLPSPDGERVFALTEVPDVEDALELVQVDPVTFALKPIRRLPGAAASDDGGFLALSPEGRRVAFASETNGAPSLVVLDGDRRTVRPLGVPGEALSLGNLVFAPRRELLYAAFRAQAEGATNAAFGFLEVPLGGGPPRRTVLFQQPGGSKEDVLYFQIGLSHDGEALAVASTYLGVEPDATDVERRALFLVNLADAQRAVTKVVLPPPPAKP